MNLGIDDNNNIKSHTLLACFSQFWVHSEWRIHG